MKIVLSTYPGSFRLPNEVKYWLLNEQEAHYLFNEVPIEESNFALNVVEDSIYAENDFAGTYDEDWGYFNSSIVQLKDLDFWGIRFAIKSGSKYRHDESLVGAIKKFEPSDFKIVEIDGDSYKVETGRNGEYLLNTRRFYEDDELTFKA
jgi:hypothetical protein